MTGFEYGDVVRVPFPYVDRPVRQHRPALVIGAPGQLPAPLLWVLMITSAENRAWHGDVPIGPDDMTGLPVRSLVRTAKIATIERSAASPLGRVSASDLETIRDLVMTSLATVRDRPESGRAPA